MANTIAGVQQKFWVTPETTFDTVVAHAAADGIDLIELQITPTLEYAKINSHLGTASLQGETEGKRGGTWSLKSYVMPKAAGTAPDLGEILKAALGTETVSASTSVTYGLTDSDTVGSLQFVRTAGANFFERINGCWVEKIEITINGGEPAQISASGGFCTLGYYYGGATVAGAHTAPDTTIALTTGHGVKIGVGALVKFGPAGSYEDNAGAGYRVTDVTTDSITITPTLAGDLADLDAVVAMELTQTASGTVLGGIASGCSVDGTAIGMISGKVEISTGIKALADEVTANRPTALLRGMRSISGEMSVYALNESSAYRGAAWAGTTRALILRAGANTAAARMLVNAPKARIEVTPVEIPEAEEATATMKFVARQNSAAADECTIVFS